MSNKGIQTIMFFTFVSKKGLGTLEKDNGTGPGYSGERERNHHHEEITPYNKDD
jgi:hypothetical protein